MDEIDNDVDAKPEDLTAEASSMKGPPRKRRRAVISCTDCHRRKQKCDRKLPCTNCTQRGKAAHCRYEEGMPLAGKKRRTVDDDENANDSPTDRIPAKAADFGYSHTEGGTLGVLSKIDGAGEPLADVQAKAHETDHFGVRQRYKSLVRQLPARPYLDKLVDVYMTEYNWQYYGLVEQVFRESVDAWFNVPFTVLSTAGPQGIQPILRAFPAVVFQVIATALLSIDEDDEEYASLKFAGKMTYEDLALEYSETGMAILSLLGKRQMTLSTVVAGWARCSFLKYTGQVTESWHQIGTSIRDAQEIGLHKDSSDPQPGPNDTTEQSLEYLWEGQARRKIWMTLVGWDLHTGAVLGRPTSVDYKTMDRSVPIDAPIPKNRRTTPLFPRGENDPPTPLTRALWVFEGMKPLRDILDMEKEGPFPKDFSRVTKFHQYLIETREKIPPPFRFENPDTRFDHLPECSWLPWVRTSMPQLFSFAIIALHRPYIFTRSDSRHEALKASLEMLEAQRAHFATLKPRQYRNFGLFFGTFDAIIILASIYILFPKENSELLSKALQHFRWSVDRFEAMAQKNRLAHAALGVLNAVYTRLKKAVGMGFVCKDAQDPSSSNGTGRHTIGSIDSESIRSGSIAQTTTSDAQSAYDPATVSSMNQSSSVSSQTPGSAIEPGSATTTGLFDSTGMDSTGLDWSIPTNFDFSAMPPMYPLGDVAYNDLTGTRDAFFPDIGGAGGMSGKGWPSSSFQGDPLGTNTSMPTAADGTGANGGVPWQFGGDFGEDTIWSLLNQLPP